MFKNAKFGQKAYRATKNDQNLRKEPKVAKSGQEWRKAGKSGKKMDEGGGQRWTIIIKAGPKKMQKKQQKQPKVGKKWWKWTKVAKKAVK